jgi:ATP-dependent helicase/nuclease subunit A
MDEKPLEGLDDDQRAAVLSMKNTVVTAGAGSGKTRVLAARYAWLILKEYCSVDEILTLTFTNKAANEMYGRIYKTLAEQREYPQARRAIDEFHRAQIGTMDSFCARVARAAARRYGVSPEFSTDNSAVLELAREEGLRFVLDKRNDPALRQLLADYKIRDIVEKVFVQGVLNYSSLSGPRSFTGDLARQETEALRVWKELGGRASETVRAMEEELRNIGTHKSAFFAAASSFFSSRPSMPPLPDLGSITENSRRETETLFAYFEDLGSIRLPGGRVSAELAGLAGLLREFKNEGGLHEKLGALANFLLHRDLSAGIGALLEEFQDIFNRQRRRGGIMGFSDISRLAVDALRDHPDIRGLFKDRSRKIMVDEFQDNNSLQRDLIFLLAEEGAGEERRVPGAEELSPEKMFFVGDEKQSIYRFRGADVSVFRRLSGDLGGGLSLRRNYRSHPMLIEGFNRIFPEIFSGGGDGAPDYEADYRPVLGREALPEDSGGEARIHFCLLDEGLLSEEEGEPDAHDLEAVFIARKIRELVESGFRVMKKTPEGEALLPLGYGDVAVLQRTYGHQSSLEKQFRHFSVPYKTDRPAGLFTDAPVNDLRAFLRLLVYPEDRIAYGALIRSPFAGLSDIVFSLCMMGEDFPPFAEELEDRIPPEELDLFRLARERYCRLAAESKTLSVTALISRLWYGEGYRFETLWSSQAQVYGELYDLFFDLAAETDKRGKSLADFLDYLEDVINREEKPDEKDMVSGEEGVRITSIHKSKGLEFPLVFIARVSGTANYNAGLVLLRCHEEWGPSLKLPGAEELPGEGGNYFHLILKEEERSRAAAELKRLLYVAMTRAESGLYLCGSRKGTAEGKKGKKDPAAFLDLLEPVISGEDRSFTVEEIPVLSRKELFRLYGDRGERVTMEEKAALALPRYKETPLIEGGETFPLSIPASGLHYEAGEGASAGQESAESFGGDGGPEGRAPGFDAAGFGTLVHCFLEGMLTGREALIPPRLRAALGEDERQAASVLAQARSMAEGFLGSELGRLCLADHDRISEYPILTLVKAGGREFSVTGQIDLLFRTGNRIHIVDFKTDRVIDPSRHIGQLALYARAVEDILNTPKRGEVRAWLYYLRAPAFRGAREITGKLGKVDIEDMVLRRLADPG